MAAASALGPASKGPPCPPVRSPEGTSEDHEGHAADQVFGLAPYPFVWDHRLRKWREERRTRHVRLGHANRRCRQWPNRLASVDDIEPEGGRENVRDDPGKSYRERDHAGERRKIEVHAQQAPERQVHPVSSALQEQHAEQADRAKNTERYEHADEHALGTIPAPPATRPNDASRRADGLRRGLQALGPLLEHHEAAELDHLVTKQGGLFELQVLGGPLHLPLEILDQAQELVLRQRAGRERSLCLLVDALDIRDVAQPQADVADG